VNGISPELQAYYNSPAWARRKRAYWKTHKRQCCVCWTKQDIALNHFRYDLKRHWGTEPDSWLIPVCKKHHERLTVISRQSRKRLFFRPSMMSVQWKEIHKMRKERNPKYKPKSKSMWQIAWELLR
jgi:hypothetical protein